MDIIKLIMEPKVFCTVQDDPANNRDVAAQLLSISMFHPGATCAVACHRGTRDYLRDFPFKMNLHISYLVLQGHSHVAKSVSDMLWAFEETYKMHGPFVFLAAHGFLVGKLLIPQLILDQKIAVLKKATGVPKDFEYTRYSIEQMYIGNGEAVERIRACFTELDHELEGANIDPPSHDVLSAYSRSLNQFPHRLHQDNKLKTAFDGGACLAMENFLAYEGQWHLPDIDPKTFEYKGVRLSFCVLRTIHLENPDIRTLFSAIVRHVISCDRRMGPIIAVKFGPTPFPITLPPDVGFAHWDRTKLSHRVHDMCKALSSNDRYFSTTDGACVYITVSGIAIVDRPSAMWITNTLGEMDTIFLCNYDDSLLSALRAAGRDTKLLTYCPEYSDVLSDVLSALSDPRSQAGIYSKTLPERMEEDDYKEFLTELSECRFMHVGAGVHYVAEALALGVVPVIIKGGQVTELLELEKNTHYVEAVDVECIDDDTWSTMSKNCREYYNKFCTLSEVARRLSHHVFIGHV